MQTNWEEEFDKEFYSNENNDQYGWKLAIMEDNDRGEQIKAFIESLLAAKDKQLLEVLEGLRITKKSVKELYPDVAYEPTEEAAFVVFGKDAHNQAVDKFNKSIDQAKQKLLSNNDDENT